MKCPVFLTSATKGPRVRRDSRKKNGVVYRPGLLLAAVLLYVLLPGGSVSASSVLRSHGFDSEAHSHHCKCGPKCRCSSNDCGPTERVRSRQCQGFPRNPGRFHPGSG